MQLCYAGAFDMITLEDVIRTYYPEINHTHIVEDCCIRLLYINFIHWLTGEVLSLFEKPIKLIAILCLWWPVNLYG